MSYDYTRAADTATAGLSKISAVVQMFLAQEARLLWTITDKSSEIAKGDKSFLVPRVSGLTAEDKTASTSLNAQRLTVAGDTISLSQHKAVLVDLEEIAELQTILNMTPIAVERASQAIVDAIEADIYTELVKTSASAPDHQVTYATSSTLSLSEIRNARRLLNVQNVPMNDRFCAIHPDQESNLLSLGDFIDASKYGSNVALINGEIGMIYGFRVVMTNAVTAATSIFYHRSHVAFGRQKEVTVRMDEDLKMVSTQILLNTVYGVEVMDSGKRGVLYSN
jgi:N4-gp56 family major capsid protein